MKKLLVFVLAAAIVFAFVGCTGQENAVPSASEESSAVSEGNEEPTSGDNEESTTESSDQPEELTKVLTSGQNVVQTAVPLVAGKVLGIWEAVGLDVDRTMYVSGPPQLEANPSGDWEIGWIGATAANAGILKYDMKVISLSGYDYSNMAFVRDDSEIYLAGDQGVAGTFGTAEEWRDKDILAPVGTVVYADLMLTLESLGLTADDVNIINMDVSTGLQAFIAGEGDVLFTCSAYASDIAKRDGFEVIHTMEGMGAGMSGTLIVSNTFLSENEDIVVKYLQGALEVMFWLGDEANDEQAAEWYVEVMKEDFGVEMSVEDALTNVKQIGFKDLVFYEDLCKTGDDGLTGLQREFKKFFDYHVTIGAAEAENTDEIIAAVDCSYLEKAIAAYKEANGIS